MPREKKKPDFSGLEVAVIGLAGRFPGARNIDEFWDNLINSRESISFSSPEEAKKWGLNPVISDNPKLVNAKGILEHSDYFDYKFFGFTPNEAKIMDPQLRVFLECAWTAIENAGYNPKGYEGLIGVYAGATPNTYWETLIHILGLDRDMGQFASANLSNKDNLSTHVSFKLNLRGPSISLQTTCSTSLVAIHVATQALLNGECHMALAGGVTITQHDNSGYLHEEGMILSSDGHCRVFDDKASGTVMGNGVGAVLLKPLEDALADRDHIYAIILGSAVNNDGFQKAGYSAPSIEGQSSVIRTALQISEIEPESIGYMEAHGTGTKLGDPIEIEALKVAFNTNEKGYCPIGSVKTNIGHLDSASGVAGFIKTVMILKNKMIPPNLHYNRHNSKIDFKNSPFFVNSKNHKWKRKKYPFRAGVSSFGIGGTNAHIILQEAPDINRANDHGLEREYKIISLSAKTKLSLDNMTNNFLKFIKQNSNLNLSDIAYTLHLGRERFSKRRFLVCKDIKEACAKLVSQDQAEVQTFFSNCAERRPIFMFPGQGAQYLNMGLELYKNEIEFRKEMDICFKILKSFTDIDFKRIMFQPNSQVDISDEIINQTQNAQVLIFIFEYALSQLLINWGIKPYAMIGHSIGEYTAACLSGVFSLKDALKLVFYRGQLMQRMSTGVMMSVPLSENELRPLLYDKISIAAVNLLNSCVVSGQKDEINQLFHRLKGMGFESKFLHTSHAFHSWMMDPILIEFEEKCREVRLNTPKIPFLSNITGHWITIKDSQDPHYWSTHLRSTVRFADGLKELFKIENVVFLEVGPGRTLSSLVRNHPKKTKEHLVTNMVRHPDQTVGDMFFLLSKIGLIWSWGIDINWGDFYKYEKRYRMPLPTYPFERIQLKVDNINLENHIEKIRDQSLNGRKKNLTEWYYIPSWKRMPLQIYKEGMMDSSTLHFLVFSDTLNISTHLIKKIKGKGFNVIEVKPGFDFEYNGNDLFKIDPNSSTHYLLLFEHLKNNGSTPDFILHFWSLSIDNDKPPGMNHNDFEKAQAMGFYSLIRLSKAIGVIEIFKDIKISVFSNNIQLVTGAENIVPQKATILGPVYVLSQECPNLTVQSIDLDFFNLNACNKERTIVMLLDEILGSSENLTVAYRNCQRWIQIFEPIKSMGSIEVHPPLRKKGVYLIIGGLGKIGLTLAEFLAKDFQARLVLIGRSFFPDKKDWEEWLESHGIEDNISIKIKKIIALEKYSAKTIVRSADVTNKLEIMELIRDVQKQFGRINGVIHAASAPQGKYPMLTDQIDSDSDETKQQFNPKIVGINVLKDIFQNSELDFFLATSSISSFLGGLGLAAYSAANIYMDKFIQKENIKDKTRWISVNWDGWFFSDDNKMDAKLDSYFPQMALSQEEGVESFRRVLSRVGLEPQIVVSTGDMEWRVKKWINKDFMDDDLFKIEADEQPISTINSNELPKYYELPKSKLEKRITKIWGEFFGNENIGIKDDFFELGGDSLKAMTLVNKIQKELNIKIPMGQIMENPTIEGFTHLIASKQAGNISSFPINPTEKREYYFLSPAQKRLFFPQYIEPKSISYNLATVVVIEGNLDLKRFQRTFKNLIRRHEGLRTSFELLNGNPIQRIHNIFQFEIEVYGLVKSEEKILGKFIRPFDLAKAPLMRVGILKKEVGKNLLIVDLHHIIVDGVSLEVIINEIICLYQLKDLPPLRLQYKDYSHWQNTPFGQKVLRGQELYWLNVFSKKVPDFEMATDFSRSLDKIEYEGDAIFFELDEELMGKIKKFMIQKDVTLYMVLLSSYFILLSKYGMQEDIVIGTPVADRTHPDFENIVGVFINMLPIRCYPNARKTIGQFLEEVKETTLKAFNNQDYPFEMLVNQLGLDRNIGRNPLFDTTFVVQKGGEEDLTIDDIKVLKYPHENFATPHEIVLEALEEETKVKFRLRYMTSLYKKETIEQFAEHYLYIIRTIMDKGSISLIDTDLNIKSDSLDSSILTSHLEEKIDFDFQG
jgi:acyl transferase domain-containing protein/acyl carrier protein